MSFLHKRMFWNIIWQKYAKSSKKNESKIHVGERGFEHGSIIFS